MINFVNTSFFLNHHYFWNPFACLLAKYVTGGSFDTRNEGSFFTSGFRLHGYVYPRHCRKRAIVLHCTLHETSRNATQWLPKWLLNSLSLHNRMTCELSTRRFYPERPEKSLETPPQCLCVIDQKWPLVVELIARGHLGIFWVGMCRPGLQIGTPSKKNFP